MAWLVDTNCWISYLKGKNLPFAQKLISTPASQVFVCAPVLAELLHGARKYHEPLAREQRVYRTLAPYRCLPFDELAAAAFAQIRHDLELKGSVIGPFDLQIAAIARAHDLTVVTGNLSEFTRVVGLKVEDWSV